MQTTRTSRPSFPNALPPGAGERARLHLEGVRGPIVTTVARRRTDALVVVQELPFLRLHSEVRDDQQRRARIARVAVDVQRDVPRLVLELAYDDDDAAEGDAIEVEVAAPARRDATIGYDQRRPDAGARASEIPPSARSAHDTLVFATDPTALRDTRPSTPPHLARRGTERQLALRALHARFRAAIDAFSHGLAAALTALRTDP